MRTIWEYLTVGVICLSGGIHIGMAINGSILKKEIDMLKNRLIRKECEIDEIKNRLKQIIDKHKAESEEEE